jgi:HlyD family secretion protein
MDKPLSQQQLNQNKAKQIATYALVTIAIISAMLLLTGSFSNSINRSEIRTAKVTKQDLKTALSAGGVIVPLFEETIASNIESQLSKVFVQPGQKVKICSTFYYQ